MLKDFRTYTDKSRIDNVRCTLIARHAVNNYIVDLTESRDHSVSERSHVSNLGIEICICFLCRDAETGDSRNILRPASQSTLLSAAVDERQQLSGIRFIQEAGSLGSVQLVPAD